MIDFTNHWSNMLRARVTDAFVLSREEALVVRQDFPTLFDSAFDDLANCIIIPGYWVTITIDDLFRDPRRQQFLYDYFWPRLMRKNVQVTQQYTPYAILPRFKDMNGLRGGGKVVQHSSLGVLWIGFFVDKMKLDRR